MADAALPDGSWATSPATRRSMLGNRRRDTSPEIALRRELHARGLRFRVDRSVPAGGRRRADIVFPTEQVAVYMDGCFWHSCPLHATTPKSNSDYWIPKLRRNRERDRETDAALGSAGWTVVRVWEHDQPAAAADRVESMVRDRRSQRR